jgi:predicted nucleotide-binding protein
LLDEVLKERPNAGDTFDHSRLLGLGLNLGFDDRITNEMRASMLEKDAIHPLDFGSFSVKPKGRSSVLAFRKAKKPTTTIQPMPTRTNKIFIVHGHDTGLKNAIRSYIGDLALTHVILHEQPDRGRTVIDKFEQESGCDFAVVTATADDFAVPAKGLPTKDPDSTLDKMKARARQNVIFELGYFVGKIGRGRVMLITDAGVELPSDLAGVVYTVRTDWTHKLWKELRAAGFSFTVDQIERATAIVS